MKSRRERQSVTNLRNNDEDLMNAEEVDLQKDNSYSDDDDITYSA